MPELNRGSETHVDNQKIREDWIAALNELMNQIKQWVSEDQQGLTLGVKEHSVEKNEEFIGSYKAPMLIINKGNSQVEICPVGRFSIGAIGSVNISNNKKLFTFLYSRKKGWIYMGNRKPLTSSMFFELFNQM